MNKIITTNGESHKKITAASISMLIIIIWVIFSAVYIIQDKWQDYQLTQMQRAYQNGITDSVRTLMAESAKCNKIPLYYGNQTVEVIALSCLSPSKEENPQASAGAKPVAVEKPSEPTAEQPTAPQNPNKPAVEQPQANEMP